MSYGQGWKNYGQQLKSNFSETWSDFANTAKGVASSVVVGDVKSAASDYLGMIGREFKRSWQNFTGFFRALFNHNAWYKYHGVEPSIAVITTRPFSTGSLNEIKGPDVSSASYTQLISIGVGHVIQQNIKVEDVRNTESWKLAMSEAFRINRMILKSNLIYSKQDFEDYIYRAMHVLMKCKQVERVLGWYNVTKADIPELQDAISHVARNPDDIGMVDVEPIDMLSDSRIAETLTLYDKLRPIVFQLSVPVKLAEYIAYYAGSVFIDQKAPNPNMYINVIRNIPIYATDDITGHIYVNGTWSIESSGIREIIDEAQDLLNRYGVLAADIAKTGMFGQVLLQPIETYSPVVLDDAGFFNLLINNYTASKGDLVNSKLINSSRDEFLRVDFLEQAGPDTSLAIMNALTTYANVPALFKIYSQNIYFSALNDSFDVNILASVDSTTDFTTLGKDSISGTGGIFLQMKTMISETYRVEHNTTSSNVWFDYDENRRADNISVLGMQQGWFKLRAGERLPSVLHTAKYGGGYADLIVLLARYPTPTSSVPNYVLALDIDSSLLAQINGYSPYAGYITGSLVMKAIPWSSSGPVMASATTINTVTLTTQIIKRSPGVLDVETDIPFTISTVDTNVTHILGSYETANASIVNFNFNVQLGIQISVANTNLVIERTNANYSKIFCEQVDYHIPLVVNHGLAVKIKTDDMDVDGLLETYPVLMKETYVPALITTLDIDNTLYWMYLGLFSVYDSTNLKDTGRYLNKRNDARRRQSKSDKNKSRREEDDDK